MDWQKRELSEMMDMITKDFPVRYLGVPLISTRLRACDCEYIKQKILCLNPELDKHSSELCGQNSVGYFNVAWASSLLGLCFCAP